MARPPSMEVFESYFQRADLDRDGRISGAEAVAFFQGSNLPKPVLAQIWMHADQNRTGFLGRQEFYNALRLVTVAQSGQELTPNIVKAALFGPPAAKIPAPQINPVGGSAPQLNSMALPAPHMGAAGSYASQRPSYGGPQAPPNMGMNQQFYPSPNTQFMRPPQTPAVTSSLPLQGSGMGIPSTQFPTSNVPNISTDWLAARQGGTSVGPTSQITNRGTTPSMTPGGFGLAQLGPTSSGPARPQEPSRLTPGVSSKLQDPVKDSKELVVSGNGFSSDSGFGGDVFSAYSSRPKQAASTPTFSLNTGPNSSVTVPTTSGPEPAAKQSQPDPFAGMVNLPTSTKLQRAPSGVNPNQFGAAQNSGIASSTVSVGAAGSASGQSQLPWQKMTQSDINKYTKVFVEVDTDRDGKITGGEARNLFLSWRLPREVLKQVWDLSDQDNDSMLSLREFCTALYFMERYREGRPLPEVLPDSVKFDVLLPPGGQPVAAYGGAAWGPAPGFPHQGIPAGRPPVAPSSASRPPAQVPVTQAGAGGQPLLQKSRVPVLEKNVMNQLGRVDQNALTSKFEEASEAEKKVEGLEKEILDSREKIEFYRTMMQELVLYKSRCDNRLNEITERALADKREVDSLGKKYEEKYKQVGDLASKLSVEEATFRDIQERKMELHNAIVKVEQGGSADGLLQVRADRIQSDLEELAKALNERCKKFELHVKPTALVELPFGWQPGIQEGSADWDEDWDKFEDEGFIIVKELTVDVPNIAAPPKPKSNLVWNNLASMDEPFTSSPTVDGKLEKPLSPGERVPESGSAYGQSEEGSTRSLPGSPLGRSTLESPSQEYPATHFDKSSAADTSPRGNETHSDDHGAAESTISGDKYTDEHSWGPTFDANDDTDSVWGFGSKETHFDSNRENAFFDSGDLGLNPIRTSSSSHADSMSHKKSTFFADSVPGTPLFNSSSSPMFGQGSEDHYFDNFSRFDSFRTHDSGFFAPQETMTRFDSIRSTRDSGAFTSFDDSDPFGPTGTFKYLESQTPRRDSDALGATSSFKYSESQTPRRDSDTFSATDSFKYSESRTPRRDSDNWSAF